MVTNMHTDVLKLDDGCKVVRTSFLPDCFMQFIGVVAGLAGPYLATYHNYTHNNDSGSCPTACACVLWRAYLYCHKWQRWFSQSMYASMAEASSHNIVSIIIILQQKRPYCM